VTVDVADIASVIVAASALGLAIYEGRQNRRLNRLELRPFVEFEVDGLAPRIEPSPREIEIRLSNKGNGAARIDSVCLQDKNGGGTSSLASEAVAAAGLCYWVRVTNVIVPHYLAAGEALRLLHVTPASSTERPEMVLEIINRLYLALANRMIVCRYSSLYEERFMASADLGDSALDRVP
jgi:hypothetical protein